MDVSNLTRDAKAVSEGKWVDNIPGMGDVSFKVRGYTATDVTQARADLERKVAISERNEDGSLPARVAEAIMREVLSKHVFMDVKNLTANGKPATAEQVRAWLLDPNYEPLANAVFAASTMVDRARLQKQEVVAKN